MTPKYRIWDKNNQTMIHLDSHHMLEFYDIGWQLVSVDETGQRFVCGQIQGGRDDGVLMQWTGESDRDSVDIFDGDIVRGWHAGQPLDLPHIGLVVSSSVEGFNGFSIRTLRGVRGWGSYGGADGGFYDYDGPRWHFLQVISDIWQDSELAK